MGFDWFITLSFHIDESTGLPYVWGPGLQRQPYNPEDYCVPEQYRQFVYLRGHLFHEYTRGAEVNDTYECNTSVILEHFPSWTEITEVDDFEHYDWSEEKHNLLKEALTWFSSKDHFNVSWSY